MKKLIFLLLLTFVVLGNFKVSAQENDRIYISVYQPDKDEITSEASKHLTNKMKNLILAHGISDEDDNKLVSQALQSAKKANKILFFIGLDERIEAEVERMLDDYWMNKNGKRN